MSGLTVFNLKKYYINNCCCIEDNIIFLVLLYQLEVLLYLWDIIYYVYIKMENVVSYTFYFILKFRCSYYHHQDFTIQFVGVRFGFLILFVIFVLFHTSNSLQLLVCRCLGLMILILSRTSFYRMRTLLWGRVGARISSLKRLKLCPVTQIDSNRADGALDKQLKGHGLMTPRSKVTGSWHLSVKGRCKTQYRRCDQKAPGLFI